MCGWAGLGASKQRRVRPGERAEATATRGGHGTALKPRVHAEVAATIAAATMVAAVEAIRAFALPRRSPAQRLPDAVLRYVASFVGSLPDVDEAVRLNRPALRAILARRLRKHVPAKLSLSALIRLLLPLTHPALDESERRSLYCAALARRDLSRRYDCTLQASLRAVRYTIATCDAADVSRAARLQHELRRLEDARA